MTIRFLLFLSMILYTLPDQAIAQQDGTKKIYTTARITDKPPNIDGVLNDEAWQLVAWGTDFVQWQPNSGAAPTEQTAFKILYDDRNLYIAFKCYDSEPEKIVRRMSRRDGFAGDWVEINIDSYFDHLTAFSFTLSASGVINDEVISNNGDNWDESWDPIWYARTAIDQEGWTGEARIPLSQIRFANKEHHIWGIQLQRRFFRKEERSTWQNVPIDAPGWVHLFGELHGISGIKPQKQVEIAPYALAQLDRFEREAGNPFATGKDSHLSMGVDGKIGITSDLTLDFTVNPDFGQVEADPSQVNLSAFEVFFQERRPFFVEGRNILEFPLTESAWGGTFSQDRLFHSRRIGRPPQYFPDLDEEVYMDMPNNSSILGALKLTGKTRKGLSIGIMESVTAKERAMLDGNGQREMVTVEPLTNYFVGRVLQDIKQGNTQIGIMATATNRHLNDPYLNFLHKSAYSWGLDFNHNWKDRTYYVAGKVATSYVNGSQQAILDSQTSSERFFQRPDASYVRVDSSRTSLTGSGGMLKFGKGGNGKIRFQSGVTWRSPEFAINDLGFMRNSDIINQWTWVGYQLPEPTKKFRRYYLNFNEFADWDFGGVNTSRGINFNTHAQFSNYWRFSMGSTLRSRQISNFDLRGGPSIKYPGSGNFWFFIASDERKKFTGWIEPYIFWGYDDYLKGHGISMTLNLQPTYALRISLNPYYEKNVNEQQYITTADFDGSPRYLTGRIRQNTGSMAIRLNYSILPNLSIEYYGQPFFSSGTYTGFKRITDPVNDHYNDRFHQFSELEIVYSQTNNEYQVDENTDGITDYSFEDPNFEFLQFRSNLVVRWEYKPGSTVYLVWNKERTDHPQPGSFSFSDTINNFFDPKDKAYNIFLLKFTYRFLL